MYQKRAWQSTSNTSVPFCMQPLKHQQGNLMTWCPGYWLELKDKLMSPCNFGCFECIEGNQHVKEFWSDLELLNYQGCSRCDGLALWMSNLTCLCVLQCICAHMCQWSRGSVGSCSTIYGMQMKWCVFESHVGCSFCFMLSTRFNPGLKESQVNHCLNRVLCWDAVVLPPVWVQLDLELGSAIELMNSTGGVELSSTPVWGELADGDAITFPSAKISARASSASWQAKYS